MMRSGGRSWAAKEHPLHRRMVHTDPAMAARLTQDAVLQLVRLDLPATTGLPGVVSAGRGLSVSDTSPRVGSKRSSS